MIPGAFAYHRPKSVSEAVALLADLGEDARPLGRRAQPHPDDEAAARGAGASRRPAGIADLKGISADGGDIVIGAMTTQHEIIASELLAAKVPILRETSLQIADPQVRYVGTLGGNVANGDPGNDMPAVMMALDATYQLAGKGGERAASPARDFYQGAYVTALAAGRDPDRDPHPVPPGRHGYAYEKLKRKIGDYATAAAAVVLTLTAARSRVLRHRPHQRRRTRRSSPRRRRRILVGSALDAATVKRAVAAAEAITSPASDRRGTAAIPHQNGRRDALARARPRQIARR